MNLGNAAFAIGRKIGKHPIAGRLFCLTVRGLPLKRIRLTGDLVVFHHPRPIADPHILVVPTSPFDSLTTKKIENPIKWRIIWEMIEIGREVSGEIDPESNWQLVINGGSRQDIGQLHGHLLKNAPRATANGVALTPPAGDSGRWHDLWEELQNASAIPEHGYSLVTTWKSGEVPVVQVQQEQANV